MAEANSGNACRLAQMILKSAQETPALLTDRSYNPTSYEVRLATALLYLAAVCNFCVFISDIFFHKLAQSSSGAVGKSALSLVPVGLFKYIEHCYYVLMFVSNEHLFCFVDSFFVESYADYLPLAAIFWFWRKN